MPKLLLPAVFLLTAVLTWAGPAGSSGNPAPGSIHVNGQRLGPAELDRLRTATGGETTGGRYWYDRLSGWWGHEGGPVAGQIASGLDLGGPLAADASRGTTRVFINGREIPTQEWAWLRQRFGTLAPGRYWINAKGRGGIEGGPASFDLSQMGIPDSSYPSGSGSWSSHEHGAEGTEWPGFRIQD